MSKSIELAKKLKALADRGIGGEKKNARVMLNRLMKKEGITLDDIDGEMVSLEKFSFKIKQKRLLLQVIYSVLGNFSYYGVQGKRNTIAVKCTKAQYAEIIVSFEMYWKALEEGIETYFEAFIMRNNIYPESVPAKERSQLSEEEIKRLLAAQKLVSGIERTITSKRLEA